MQRGPPKPPPSADQLAIDAQIAAKFGIPDEIDENADAVVDPSEATLGKKRGRPVCMEEPEHRSMYQMIVRQLHHDGFVHAAEAVATSTSVLTPGLRTDATRLSQLVRYGLVAENMLVMDRSRHRAMHSAEAALAESALYVQPMEASTASSYTMSERFCSSALGGVVRCCEFSQDGCFLAASGSGGVGVRLMSINVLDKMAAYEQTRSAVTAAAAQAEAPERQGMRHAKKDNEKRQEQADGGAKMAATMSEYRHIVVPGALSVDWVSFHPRNPWLAYGTRGGSVEIKDYTMPQEKTVLKTNEGKVKDSVPVRSGSFLPNGQQLLYAGDDKTLRLFDLESESLLAPTAQPHTAALTGVACSGDGTKYVTSSMDGTWALVDVQSGTITHHRQKAHSSVPVTSVQFSRSGNVVLTNGMDAIPRLWDLRKTNVEVASFGEPTKPVRTRLSARFNFSERAIIAHAPSMMTLNVHDIYSGDVIGAMVVPDQPQRCFASAPEELTVVSGADDCCLHLWGATLRPQLPA